MAHRLNTNKQFMVGNGILAFAVIFVVVIFIYMSMRLQQKQQEERHFIDNGKQKEGDYILNDDGDPKGHGNQYPLPEA